MSSDRSKSYFTTVNFLRALAVLMICLFHFSHYNDFRGQFLGDDDVIYSISNLALSFVHLFFVVSGFVIPLSMHRSNYTILRYHRFISRRLIRIGIPYLVTIMAVVAVSLAFALKNNTAFSINASQLLHHLTFTVQFTDHEWYNPIFWTLAIEIQFYILAGILYPFVMASNRYLAVLSILLFASISVFWPEESLITFFAPQFAMGLVLFLMITNRISRLPGYILILVLQIWLSFLHNGEIALICSATVLLIDFVRIDKAWLNYLGDISYSLYLSHGLVGGNLIFLFWKYTESTGSKYLLILFALLASIIFSRLMFKYIEGPSLKLSRKIKL